MDWPTWITAIAALVAAAATIIYTITTVRMLKGMQRANLLTREAIDIARASLQATHRPFVGVEHVRHSFEPANRRATVSFRLVNAGNWPATGMKVRQLTFVDGKQIQTQQEDHQFLLLPKAGYQLHVVLLDVNIHSIQDGQSKLEIDVSSTYRGIAANHASNSRYIYLARFQDFVPETEDFS